MYRVTIRIYRKAENTFAAPEKDLDAMIGRYTTLLWRRGGP